MDNPSDPRIQDEPINPNRDTPRPKFFEVLYIKANTSQDALEHLKVGRGFHTMQNLESFFGKNRKHVYRGVYLIEPLDEND
jgi:hypothetical protein